MNKIQTESHLEHKTVQKVDESSIRLSQNSNFPAPMESAFAS